MNRGRRTDLARWFRKALSLVSWQAQAAGLLYLATRSAKYLLQYDSGKNRGSNLMSVALALKAAEL